MTRIIKVTTNINLSYCVESMVTVFCFCRIYTVHDEIKDKNFELDLSWVGASKSIDLIIYTYV